jgi:hypothetical protein
LAFGISSLHSAFSPDSALPRFVEIPMKSFLCDEEYKKLDGSTIEVKGMLAGLIEKVEAIDKRAELNADC